MMQSLHLIVSKNDKFITEINPKRLYHSSDSPMTEAGINGRIDRDLYVSLGIWYQIISGP